MGYDLLRGGGEWVYVNGRGWRDALRSAYDNGWRPFGTSFTGSRYGQDRTPLDAEEVASLGKLEAAWDPMDYFSNDFQYVRHEDAVALGTALQNVQGFEWLAAFCKRGSFVIS